MNLKTIAIATMISLAVAENIEGPGPYALLIGETPLTKTGVGALTNLPIPVSWGPDIEYGLPDYLDGAKLSVFKLHRYAVELFNKRTEKYNEFIYEASAKYSVQKSLIRAVMMYESGGNYQKLGTSGEIGLTQIKPSTAKYLGYKGSAIQLYRPNDNIFLCAKLLSILKKRYDLNLSDTVAAYNQGSVFRWRKGAVPLQGLQRKTGLRYGKLIRLDKPYDPSLYGPYYNAVYVYEIMKWFDIFSKVYTINI